MKFHDEIHVMHMSITHIWIVLGYARHLILRLRYQVCDNNSGVGVLVENLRVLFVDNNNKVSIIRETLHGTPAR